MKLSYEVRLTLVIINALCVIMAMAHVPVMPYAALMPAQFLFVYYAVNFERTFGVTGAMFNYIGVVSAAVGKLELVWFMAIYGSILMLWDAIPKDKQK